MKGVIACILASVLVGCSTPVTVRYPIRTSRLISPEAQGRAGAGTGSVFASWSHEVVMRGDNSPDGLATEFDDTVATLNLATHIGLAERWDIFFQSTLADTGDSDSAGPFGAIYAGGKYQILGEPRLRARAGNFSLAATLSPGFSEIDDTEDGTRVEANIWIIDASLVAGYRFTDQLLLYGGPFFTYHEMDASEPPRPDFSSDGHSYGTNLGLRHEWTHVAIDLEAVWSEARWQDARDTHIGVGFGVHFFWGRDESTRPGGDAYR